MKKLIFIIFSIFSTYCTLDLEAQAQQFFTTSCHDIENGSIPTICDLNLIDGFSGTMFSEIPTSGSPAPLCSGTGGIVHNMTWFAFVAGAGDFQLEITATNCDTIAGEFSGMQVGIYDDCSYINPVWCVPDCQQGIITSDAIFVAGQTYFVFFDGCAGSVCDFEINIIGTYSSFQLTNAPVVILDDCDTNIDGFPLCTGASVQLAPEGYEMLDTDSDWNITGPDSIETISSDDVVLEYSFATSGEYTFSYVVSNGCSFASDTTTFVVLDTDDEILNYNTVCSGETFFPSTVSWLGENINAPLNNTGSIITDTVFHNALTVCGCAYTQSLIYDIYPQSPFGKPVFYLCPEDLDFFSYNGIDIDIATPHGLNVNLTQDAPSEFITDINGCDSLVDLTIHIIEMVGNLSQSACSDGMIEISFEPSAVILPVDQDSVLFIYEWQSQGITITDNNNNDETLIVNPIDSILIDLVITAIGPENPDSTEIPIFQCSFFFGSELVFSTQPDIPSFANNSFPPICPTAPIQSYMVIYQSGINYIWDIFDGSITSGQGTSEITVDWTGTSSPAICVSATDSCGIESSQLCENIQLLEFPSALFSTDAVTCINQEVLVQVLTPEDSSYTYNWSFDENPTGPLPVGTDLFMASWSTAGIKTISLRIMDELACESVPYSQQIIIEDLPNADFTVSNLNNEISLTNNSTIGAQYLWEFGDGNTSNEFDPIHTYGTQGIYNITLIVTNTCGSDTTSIDINTSTVSNKEITYLDAIKIFPTPTSDILNISLGEISSDRFKIHLYDIRGNKLNSNTIQTIRSGMIMLNLERLRPGMYILAIDLDGDQILRKIIVE